MSNPQLVVSINARGQMGCLYAEEIINFRAFGKLKVRRASHVEFNNKTQRWTVTLVNKVKLGTYPTRKEALKVEVRYLNKRIMKGTIEEVFK